MKKLGYHKLLAGLLISLTICSNVVFAQDNSEARQVVKVGFFASDGYHVQDEDGVKSGYGYDFLKMAENYSNWRFDYVGYELGWESMLTMLENGEIDLLTYAQKTPEREERFDYSTNPIGTSADVLVVRKDDARYQVGEPNTYEGMRIGLERGTTHLESMSDFAEEKGFHYVPVYYNNRNEMKEDLEKGQNIDGMLISNYVLLDQETVLDELDPIDFYVIVKKGNTVLLDQINNAILQMDKNTPGWRLDLKNKYYASNFANDIMMNKSEMEYLMQLKDSNTVLKVVTNPDLAPYSSIVNGIPQGIVPSIFEEIADRLGLHYEYVPIENYEDYNQYVKDGKADIDLTCFSDYGLAEVHGIELTNSYLSTEMALLTKEKAGARTGKMALLQGAQLNTSYTEDLLQENEKVLYDTNEECINAVLRGTVDGMFMYAYQAQQAVEQDVRNRLTYSIMPEYSIDMAFGVNQKMDYRMVSILNKSITGVKGNFAKKVIQNQLTEITKQQSLAAFLYDYPFISMLFVGVFFASIFLLCLYFVISKHRASEAAHARELARFVGYVCEANEAVQEIDLNTLEGFMYCMEDQDIQKTHVYYPSNERQDVLDAEELLRLKKERNAKSFWDIFKIHEDGDYFEAKAKGVDGQYRWYSYTLRAIPGKEKESQKIILFKKNIDHVKMKEEEQKHALEDALQTAKNASTAKGQFLSRMSHEIRTPLNAVIGYMQIAKDSGDNTSKLMHCVENSDVAAKHLLSIINDVLDISSIESGKMKLAHEEFDLKSQLTAISTMFYNQAREKGVRFEVTLEEITNEWVIGDSLRVNQILMNLLSNAVKFTPENGAVALTVTQVDIPGKRVFMKFSVKDSGIGMSEEYQKRLFEPFEQESAKTAQKYGGTGLGLSITYNLVQMMGGSIEVNSKQNEGTTFTVSLYFDRGKGQQEQIQKEYSHVRVLIVDDDEAACEYMKSMLKRCKVKCDVAMDGENAIKQLKRRMGTVYQYDMCIMDWNMPKLDGIETAKRIRQECDQKLPIIIATAYDMTEYTGREEELGIDKIIAKPVFQSTMFDLLVSMFGKYQPEEKLTVKRGELKGIHVLLAEDNPMNMEIAEEILKKAGLLVTPVTDGEQAFQTFTKAAPGTYDAILMDIQMPVMDGYQATMAIRKSTHKEAASIPIIAMTANAFAEDVTAALASGMNGHIAKPVNYDKLYEVLEKFCVKKEEVVL